MRSDQLPPLLPTGTALHVQMAKPSFPADLLELFRAGDMGETAAFLAWQLAEMAVDLSASERTRFMLAVGRLLLAHATGSTCHHTIEAERALLVRVPDLVHVAQGGHLPSPVRLCTPLVLDGEFLYSARDYAAESRLAARVAALFRRRSAFTATAIARALDDVASTASPAPSTEQRAAVASALGRHLGIISGGPGTGKTTTVLALVRSLVRLGVSPTEIGLCAPTGKAASRLENDFRGRLGGIMPFAEADRALRDKCPQAQTLHRLLGASRGPGGVLRTNTDPLPFRAVIVDESSMMDLELADRLFVAVTDDALVILLGDADQLPSVAAGSVFRDLERLAVRLSRGFRTDVSRGEGKSIADLAAAIRKGDSSARLLLTPRATATDLVWRQAENVPAEKRSDVVRTFYRRTFASPAVVALTARNYHVEAGAIGGEDAAALDELAAHLTRARILAVTRSRAAGVERCNAFLHDLHGGGPGFLPGEPVMVSRNDYERDLWNGDQGVAVRAERQGQTGIAVAFRTRKGWRAFDPRVLEAGVELGFALTVHKAQGSEMDEVLLLVPDFSTPLLSRELLYTAVSRARRSVVVCGDPALFAAGVAAAESRDSQLARRIEIESDLDLPSGLR